MEDCDRKSRVRKPAPLRSRHPALTNEQPGVVCSEMRQHKHGLNLFDIFLDDGEKKNQETEEVAVNGAESDGDTSRGRQGGKQFDISLPRLVNKQRGKRLPATPNDKRRNNKRKGLQISPNNTEERENRLSKPISPAKVRRGPLSKKLSLNKSLAEETVRISYELSVNKESDGQGLRRSVRVRGISLNESNKKVERTTSRISARNRSRNKRRHGVMKLRNNVGKAVEEMSKKGLRVQSAKPKLNKFDSEDVGSTTSSRRKWQRRKPVAHTLQVQEQEEEPLVKNQLIVPEKNGFVLKDLFSKFRSVEFCGPGGAPATTSDPYIVSVSLKRNALSFGFLFIRPKCEQQSERPSDHSLVFNVILGNVFVTVNGTSFVAKKRDVFVVPAGNECRIKNRCLSEAKLSFCRINE